MKIDLKRKYESQLGTSLGKARNELYNKVLLNYAQQSNNDMCSKCNSKIEHHSDLSIDHIKPWRNSEKAHELYFDLDNVSLAHKNCNTTDRPGKIELPEGMSYCSYHKSMHHIEEFGKGKRWNGVDYMCLEAHRIKQARYADKNPRFSCPNCNNKMRKKCRECSYEIPMSEYMRLRRSEGAEY